uniref:Uncharacterized protein n=1 Tax=CrAss-like virus sp. ctRQZ5 TaxID=2826824 RepID=A0A8S5LXX0_9CAUD|nr:MAG TPA: hypothetical protein [CrAss-like virus sp. ctRQZ5]DAF01164.1 MAG TPA: hypothetical protein [Caudoviricetes sp.]DAU94390.1 MAG TPA: hypothetical protein [Caudoviricetes sp.]
MIHFSICILLKCSDSAILLLRAISRMLSTS